MANSFSADFAEIWAKEQQIVFHKENVAMKIADTSFKSQMSFWDTLNRPYRSSNNIQAYTRWTAITINDKTDTNEQLVVNKQYANWFYVDDFDRIQSSYNLIANYGRDEWVLLSNQVDADVLGEYSNATSTVDDWTLGGTSGNGIALTTSNVLQVLSASKRKLAKQNVPISDLFWVISPEFEDILIQQQAARNTWMWDWFNKDWAIMDLYGFRLYRSNQTAGSAILALATQPTNGDTLTIQWVTFTFVSSIGTTAWNVLIGANVDVTRASLVALINDPSTTSSTQVALATNDKNKFIACVTATNDNTANTATVIYKWAWVLTVSETLTDWTDTWTAVKQKQHNLFGRKGAVVLVMQSEPRPQIKQVPDKLWVNILNWVLYWVKTFADWAKQLVNAEIKSSAY